MTFIKETPHKKDAWKEHFPDFDFVQSTPLLSSLYIPPYLEISEETLHIFHLLITEKPR